MLRIASSISVDYMKLYVKCLQRIVHSLQMVISVSLGVILVETFNSHNRSPPGVTLILPSKVGIIVGWVHTFYSSWANRLPEISLERRDVADVETELATWDHEVVWLVAPDIEDIVVGVSFPPNVTLAGGPLSLIMEEKT